MRVSFGEFVLDLDSRELLRGAEPVRLSPKAFQLLEILVTSRPRALSKAELQDRLWPDTAVVEKNLANLVSEIRQVLGEDPAGGRLIRTVPRFGYAFSDMGPPRPEPGPGPTPVSVRRWSSLALGSVAVLVIAGFAAIYSMGPVSRAPGGPIRLGVLPLQNLTGDPEQDYLCDGLTEELIAQLGSADPERLFVIARTSAMHYRKTTKRAQEVGRELSAGYLLETSLRRVGDRVRITAQLVATESEVAVWAEQHERDVGDVLALQREVASAVVRRTIASLGVTARRSPLERHSSNVAAYEHYRRGRHQWLKGTRDGLQKARDHFQHAITLDPSYAHAHSGLAETYFLIGSYGLMPLSESHPLAREAALQALALDDALAAAHRSLAVTLFGYYWERADAERHFQRAMDLAPNDVTTLRTYSFHLACLGRFEEALSMAERASSLDPVSPTARLNLGVVLYIARRPDEAARQLEETLDLDEHFGFAHAILGLTYASQQMPERAVAELQRARALEGTRPDIVAVHGYALARVGRRTEALATLDDVRRLTNPQSPPPFQMALVYIGLEDWDRAFEWLGKAIEARSWEIPLLKVDPAFDRLRADSRYPGLLARVGLPE